MCSHKTDPFIFLSGNFNWYATTDSPAVSKYTPHYCTSLSIMFNIIGTAINAIIANITITANSFIRVKAFLLNS